MRVRCRRGDLCEVDACFQEAADVLIGEVCRWVGVRVGDDLVDAARADVVVLVELRAPRPLTMSRSAAVNCAGLGRVAVRAQLACVPTRDSGSWTHIWTSKRRAAPDGMTR